MTQMHHIKVDEDLEDLVPEFLDKRQIDIQEIRQQVAQGDFATIAKRAHDMVGVGRTYGFDLVSQLGRVIETAAKAAQGQPILQALEELQGYLDHLEIEFVPEEDLD